MLGLHVKLLLSIQLVLSDAQKTCQGHSWAIQPYYSHLDMTRSRVSGSLSRHWEVERSDSGEGNGGAIRNL